MRASTNIHHQDSFLDNIAKQLGRPRRTQIERPVWKHQPQLDLFKDVTEKQLIELLKEQAEKIHTEVVFASTETLPSVLDHILDHLQSKSIVSWDDKRIEEFGLQLFFEGAIFKGFDVHIWDPSIGQKNIEFAEKADIGITFSDITLAESASVVLLSDKGKARSVSLLPKIHVAIIPKSSIVPRMTQAMQHIKRLEEQGRKPSCINIISGPSNSADIEMNLVVGVHGPLKAIYIIIDDA
nr:lactate utilization protein C [Paenibacillus bovis]